MVNMNVDIKIKDGATIQVPLSHIPESGDNIIILGNEYNVINRTIEYMESIGTWEIKKVVVNVVKL